jgi:hypothetical protein
MGLWPAPDSIESLEISNFGQDGVLSIKIFVLMMVEIKKSDALVGRV